MLWFCIVIPMMDGEEQLRNINKRRLTPRPLARTERLGNTLSKLMERKIQPQRARFEQVDELWSQLLPAELGRHCEITDISSGQLKVLVDSPSHANELRWCSTEITAELQRQCPRARIKEIKIIVG